MNIVDVSVSYEKHLRAINFAETKEKIKKTTK